MSIPDYQTIMLPLLNSLRDGKEHSFRKAVESLAGEFQLTHEERAELLSSGSPVFDNRVGWARTYLKKAGLIDASRRGFFRISSRGRQVLTENPPRIDVKYLERFPEFVEFRKTRREKDEGLKKPEIVDVTPEEALEAAYQKIRGDIESELLDRVKAASSGFFERIVVELIVKMGYGGTLKDAGKAIGRTGDGGIDGIIKEDRLGLDAIYVQAKQWDTTVGRPEVQKFAGALQGYRGRKGVFITTSNFSKEAQEYASMIETKIVFIDGTTLAQLMFDHNVGVSQLSSYQIKKIDSDYFTEE